MLSEKIIKTIHEEFPELQNLVSSGIEAEAQKIRDSIPSGFVELGELDYDYMLNNENVVKLKNKSIAYVNGYRVEIPAGTIIDIGKAPEKELREDLLFLEVWKDEDFNRDGQVKWRIRHIPNLNPHFNEDCMTNGGYGWITSYGYYPELVTGGNSEILAFETANVTAKYNSGFIKANNSNANIYATHLLGDSGLFVCGTGTDSAKTRLKTLDGFVYAIPMFRLYRKPSCGKSIPFEYQKINPKVDYAKFANLMKEERVERVVSENIGGRSLVNHYNGQIETYKTSSSSELIDEITTLKPNTTYTICLLAKSSNSLANVSTTSFLRLQNRIENTIVEQIFGVTGAIPSSHYRKIVETFTTPGTMGTVEVIFRNAFGDWGLSSNTSYIKDIVILEGDWINKPLPKFFTGLKSLGEDEGNLIEVKTGILNPSSYDPSTGNVKLNTVSGTNYVSCDNLIMPEIEAQIKRGENKLSDLTALGKVENLVGDEKVDFIKIKGRTIQNLLKVDSSNYDFVNPSITISDGVITAPAIGDYNSFNIRSNNLFKPSTKYTLVVNVISNTLTNRCYIATSYSNVVFDITTSSWIDSKQVGLFKFLLTTKSDITNCTIALRSFVDNVATSGEIKLSYMILEGDYINTPVDQLPYVNGIKSVGENEENKIILNRINPNLITEEMANINNWYNVYPTRFTCENNGYKNLITYTNLTGGWEASSLEVNGLEKDKYYTLSFDYKVYKSYGCLSGYEYAVEVSKNKNTGTAPVLSDIIAKYKIETTATELKRGSITFKAPDKTIYIVINGGCIADNQNGLKFEFNNFQLTKSIESIDFSEPFEEYKQEITLKEPLRSLPNGVCDTIEGNKVIRRVGKMILNGTENWQNLSGTQNDTTYFAQYLNVFNMKGISNYAIGGYCDTLTFLGATEVYNVATTTSCIGINAQGVVQIRQLKSQLPSIDIQGLKTWLSQNPTTVYYELATPIEEIIEPNYDKESVKTYQLDAPLRSLSNGVKDEIIDGKLIRRCGETFITGKENWLLEGKTGANFISTPINDAKPTSTLVCDKLSSVNIGASASTNPIGAMFTMDSPPRLRIKYSQNDVTLEEAKIWLQTNPIKVIYELATPIEIPLKEVHSNTANFSLKRQFADGNWLRELPNGVKDTIENGKVIRRVGKALLSTATGIDLAETNSNTLRFRFNINGAKVQEDTSKFCVMSDSVFKYTSQNYLGVNYSDLISSHSLYSMQVRILKSRLQTPDVDGFKAWLAQNPVTVLYELATPTEEPLSTDNYMYYPHHEINTYCGSLYVGNGTNDVFVENGLKNDGVVIDTPFRSIEDKAIVDDCRYKKNVDGYDTTFITSSSTNLLNFSNFYSKVDGVECVVNKNGFTIRNTKATSYAHVTFKIYLKANVKYKINYTSTNGGFSDIYTFNNGSGKWVGNLNNGTVITVAESGYYLAKFYCTSNVVSCSEATFSEIRIVKGDVSVPYEDYRFTSSYLENTESNDVDDLRHQVSLTGFNYDQMLNENFDKLLRGEL